MPKQSGKNYFVLNSLSLNYVLLTYIWKAYHLDIDVFIYEYQKLHMKLIEDIGMIQKK